MIDVHAHILPGVDDGPSDMDGAVALAQSAVAAGTSTIATTSHVDLRFGLDPSAFSGWREKTQRALDEAGVPLRLVSGGELGLTRSQDLSVDDLREICLGDGATVLLEPPFTPAGPAISIAVARLQRLGFDVLLAHPERSPDFLQRPDLLIELTNRGARIQVTASSLAGKFGHAAQRFAFELFYRGAVHVIASDAHGADNRTPDMHAHLDAMASQLPDVSEARDYWTVLAPGAIVTGSALPAPPAVRRPRRRFGRRRRS